MALLLLNLHCSSMPRQRVKNARLIIREARLIIREEQRHGWLDYDRIFFTGRQHWTLHSSGMFYIKQFKPPHFFRFPLMPFRVLQYMYMPKVSVGGGEWAWLSPLSLLYFYCNLICELLHVLIINPKGLLHRDIPQYLSWLC